MLHLLHSFGHMDIAKACMHLISSHQTVNFQMLNYFLCSGTRTHMHSTENDEFYEIALNSNDRYMNVLCVISLKIGIFYTDIYLCWAVNTKPMFAFQMRHVFAFIENKRLLIIMNEIIKMFMRYSIHGALCE